MFAIKNNDGYYNTYDEFDISLSLITRFFREFDDAIKFLNDTLIHCMEVNKDIEIVSVKSNEEYEISSINQEQIEILRSTRIAMKYGKKMSEFLLQDSDKYDGLLTITFNNKMDKCSAIDSIQKEILDQKIGNFLLFQHRSRIIHIAFVNSEEAVLLKMFSNYSGKMHYEKIIDIIN